MIALIGAALAADAPPPCPAVPPLLDAATAALVEVETSTAQARMDEAEEALLACREIFDPLTLGRLWLLEGALRSVEGDEPAANDAFAASGRVAPEAWQDVFGPTIRGQYELARVRDPGASVLDLLPELGANRAWVDGAPVEGAPIETTGGLHALQIADPTGVVLFSQVLWLAPEERMALETGVPTAARIDTVEAPVPVAVAPPKKRVDPLLVSGAGAVAVGGALLAVSFERSAAMRSATDPDALRARFHEHSATRISGVGLLGLGALAVGASFAF
ncbi:MAG: hypothetical protein H6737_06410 [Alphaproteobacteria bacterium]|nr:hypothetical protein [Alphaproteobacteria bacterium]